MSEFVTVARTSQVPSDRGLSICVGNREFALFKIEGEFYALDAHCPHRGGPLGEGLTENGHVFCPLHGWEFDVRTGGCISHPEKSVVCFPVEIHDDQVRICLDQT